MPSSNPFRKQTNSIVTDFDASSVPRASRPPPPVSFGSSELKTDPEIPAVTKTKVVKRVRVLSPPPLSPDSPEWPNNDLPVYQQHDSIPTEAIADSDRAMQMGGVPGVTFGQPQQGAALAKEMKKEGEALKAGNKAMDVDAFKRLLMTGDKPVSSNDATETQTVPQPATLPAALPLRQLEEEESLSDSSMSVQFGSRKKAPPPPPSSRHGKAIRNNNVSSDVKATSPMAQSFTAGPRATGGLGDEPSHEVVLKKATPAPPPPPPPRGHTRNDSKVQASSSAEPRSSNDAPQLQTHNIRHSSAPVPPPPRRPNAGHRLSSNHTSPTSGNFPDAEPHDDANETAEGHLGQGKHPVSPPPPPPARNTSVRRPPSAEVKAKDGTIPPPPPPTRKRGTSKGNDDRPRTNDPGQGDALLADLSALQREVDAAMGKLG